MVIDPCVGVTVDAARARLGTKWNKHGDDVLGAWVADMDFAVPEPIRDVLAWHVAHSALGYERAEATPELFAAASRWLATRHGWEPDPAMFATLSELIQGILLAVHAFTDPGDRVIVQGPIYPPFLTSITTLGRRIVDNGLIDPTGAAVLDLDGLRRLAADPRTKLLLLCNPHNPVGRVFRRDELEAIASIAVEHDLVVLADEVWMDITYGSRRHVPFATIGHEAARRTITMTSTSKSFNIAGLRCAVAVFGSEALRARFDVLPPRVRGAVNVMGVRASTIAWTGCGAWLDAVVQQLDANRRQVEAFVRERLPGVKHRSPEGTYLAWLDFGSLGLGRPAAVHLLERGRVALNDGSDFGGYGQCARLNFATTPEILTDVLERIERAVR
jgi:cystathionine beta-lyase